VYYQDFHEVSPSGERAGSIDRLRCIDPENDVSVCLRKKDAVMRYLCPYIADDDVESPNSIGPNEVKDPDNLNLARHAQKRYRVSHKPTHLPKGLSILNPMMLLTGCQIKTSHPKSGV
jgi:hypothetical protein